MTESVRSEYFQSRFSYDSRRCEVWRAIVDFLQQRYFPKIDAVLDLGCGYGDFINHVRAGKKYAVDLVDVRKFLNTDVEFQQRKVTDLTFIADSSIDLVFASNLLEHLEWAEIDKLLKEIQRVLVKSGRLVLIQPNFRLCAINYFDDYTHRTILSDISLKDYLSANGMKVIQVKPGFLPFSMQGFLPKSYFLTRMFLELGSPLLGKQMLIVAEK